MKKTLLLWSDVYRYWEYVIRYYPELKYKTFYKEYSLPSHHYGQSTYYDWVNVNDESGTIEKSQESFDTLFPEIGWRWTQGTIHSLSLFYKSPNIESQAAVWITAYMLCIIRNNFGTAATRKEADRIAMLSAAEIIPKYCFWHYKSKTLFPEIYIPDIIDREEIDIPDYALIDFAAANAAFVLAHYVPVVFDRN